MEVKTNSGPLQEQTAEELKVNIGLILTALVRGGTSDRPDPANFELIGVREYSGHAPQVGHF